MVCHVIIFKPNFKLLVCGPTIFMTLNGGRYDNCMLHNQSMSAEGALLPDFGSCRKSLDSGRTFTTQHNAMVSVQFKTPARVYLL